MSWTKGIVLYVYALGLTTSALLSIMTMFLGLSVASSASIATGFGLVVLGTLSLYAVLRTIWLGPSNT